MHRSFALVLGVSMAVSAVSAAAQRQSATAVPQTRVAALPSRLPRSNQLATVQGNAVTPMNGSLANTMVRLRDARFGRVVNTQFTDKTGAFLFRAVDPGN